MSWPEAVRVPAAWTPGSPGADGLGDRGVVPGPVGPRRAEDVVPLRHERRREQGPLRHPLGDEQRGPGRVDDSKILPKVAIDSAMKPVLGNTAMESYDRSNCIGCHAKGSFANDTGATLSTDMMYFLQLQVSAPAASRPAFAADLESGGGGGGGGCAVVPQRRGGVAWIALAVLPLLMLRRRHRKREVSTRRSFVNASTLRS